VRLRYSTAGTRSVAVGSETNAYETYTLTAGAGDRLRDGDDVDLLAAGNYESAAPDLQEIKDLDASSPVRVLVQEQLGRQDVTIASGVSAVSVDSISIDENAGRGNVKVDVTASVSDTDGDDDLSSITFQLFDTNTGTVDASESVSIGGGSATETVNLQTNNDGNAYEVRVFVTDADGNTASDSRAV